MTTDDKIRSLHDRQRRVEERNKLLLRLSDVRQRIKEHERGIDTAYWLAHVTQRPQHRMLEHHRHEIATLTEERDRILAELR